MKRFRRWLATALTVVLLAGTLAVPSYGEEAKHGVWKYEDNVWHYYNSDGKLLRSKEKQIKGKWYAFDENGRMYEDELFVSPKTEDEYPNRYAFPDGHLAAYNWVKLNSEGHMYSPDDARDGKDIFWYFFKGSDTENVGGGSMIRDKEKTINKKVYRFYEDGHMYSREWYGQAPVEGDTLPKADTYYYGFNGEKAVNKWLPLDDVWYHFNSEGLVDEMLSENSLDPATGSNAKAPYPKVQSVEPVGDTEVAAVVGEPVKLKFKVKLASDSNAEKSIFTEKGHDIWATPTLIGKFNIYNAKVEENGFFTAEYTPQSLSEEEVSLFVDGKESAPITVKPSLENAASKEDAVNTLLEALIDPSLKGDVTSKETLEAISEVIANAVDEEKEALQNSIANSGNYSTIENVYVRENRIDVKPVNVDEKAKKNLNVDKISMVGGALNAKETIELRIAGIAAPSQSEAPLAQTYNMKLAFDIVMEVDGAEATELTFPAWITMPVPEGFHASSMKLFHIHDGKETEVKFYLSENKDSLDFMASKFSSYIFVQNSGGEGDTGNSHSGSGGSSSTTKINGQWILDANGWWYKYSDNTYPLNTWAYLAYGNETRSDWYRFDQNGYMKTGWFTDTDGRIYYLNPVSNGFLGAMQTGWQQIDGHWYYFSEESNGYKGMLLVNTTTPDGHRVNESGQRID